MRDVAHQYNVLGIQHLHEAVLGMTLDLSSVLHKGMGDSALKDLTRVFDAGEGGAAATAAPPTPTSRRVGRVNVNQ